MDRLVSLTASRFCHHCQHALDLSSSGVLFRKITLCLRSERRSYQSFMSNGSTRLAQSPIIRSNNSSTSRFLSQSTRKVESHSKQPLWKRLLIVSCVGGLGAYVIARAQREKDLKSEKLRYEEFSKSKLGGDWSLIDHHGNKRSSSDFHGHWCLIYFGFTHCPDICPEELEKLTLVIKKFDETPKLPKFQPVFITLDPERDTPSAIKDYCAEFQCPRLLGFTGTEEDIRALAKKYRVYFGKGPKDEDNDYIIDHTIVIYLVNPDGQFVNYYGRSMTADKIVESVKKHVDLYNGLKR